MKSGTKISDHISMTVGKGLSCQIGVRGVFVGELYNAHGILVDRREVHNTVTTLGIYMLADQLDDTPSIALPGWMEVGTGDSQGAGDSILDAYISGSRTALDSSTTTNDDIVMTCTLAAGTGTGAITEAGVFNVVTQNTTDLILYSDFSVINKGVLDNFVLTWTLTIA